MRFNLSIRFKLIGLFIILTLIPSAIMAGVAFINGRDILEKNLGLKLEELASQSMARIDNLLFLKKEDIALWSSIDLTQDVIDNDTQGRITTFLTRMKKNYLVYTGLFCVNNQGRIIASSEPGSIGHDVSGEPWYLETMETKEYHIHDIEFDQETGSFGIRFSIPVKASSDDTQVIGSLSGLLGLEELSRLTNSIKVTERGQSNGAFAVLLDGKGAIVAAPDFLFEEKGRHPEDPNYWKKTVSEFTKNYFSLNYESARLAIKGDKGYLAEKDPNGQKWIIGYAGSNGYGDFKGLGWSVLTLLNIHMTTTFNAKLRSQLAAVGLIILLPVLLTGIFLSRRFEIPIRKLIDGTRLIAQGDLSKKIRIRTGDEVEQLADAFNKMTADLKKSRDGLLAAKEYINNIIESMLDPLIVIDHEGKIENVNAAACTLTRHQKEELVGADVNSIFMKKIYEKDTAAGQWLNKSPAGGQETKLKTSAGDEIPVSVSWSVLRQNVPPEAGRDGTDATAVHGYVIVAHDITARIRMENILATMNGDLMERERVLSLTLSDLKKAHEELKQIQMQVLHTEKLASIGQLAAGVAHEINNPVGFVSNNVEILEQYVNDYTRLLRATSGLKEPVRQENWAAVKTALEEIAKIETEINLDYLMKDTPELLRHTRAGIERIRKIVMDLRTFSRDDKDTVERVKVEDIIEGVLNIVQHEIQFKAELKKDYADTPFVLGSPQRIGQVFINLLMNAAQAMDEKGTIEIKTSLRDGYVCADVRDTGKGIPEENIKKIFDPFFTTKPVGQGTGLGLSVSYEIIKKHGGDIRVQSQPGAGTTFTVMLPVEKKAQTEI
ncbi:MAG: PAS domain S-box protein [Candidatus Omnitrophica bacterium]|nr:PAS domain S-box protein [Candidatus Omnitrophota bacterium]